MTKRSTKGRLNDGGKKLRLARRTTTTTTVSPIACLLEWDSAECQIFHLKRPLFAPNLAYSKNKYGLITPVLPISQIAEESVESKSLPIALLTTSETIATTTTAKTVTSTGITIAQLEQPENLAQEQEYHQATVNGEFTERTHTFLSTTIITTTTTTTTITTTIITTATTHISTTTTIIDTSTFSLFQKHDINDGIFAIPKTNSNRKVLTPSLFRFDIDEDNDNDDDDDDDRFAFFWPTVSPFQTQTAIISSPQIKNLETLSPVTFRIIPANTFHWSDSTTEGSFQSLTMQEGYRSNEDKYGKLVNPTSATNTHLLSLITRNNISQHEYGSYTDDYSGYHYRSDKISEYNSSYQDGKHKHGYPNNNRSYFRHHRTNPECNNYPNANYSNCRDATIISTFPTSLSPRVSFASSAPLSSSNMTTKIMQISSAMSQQSNRNYFEDLWNDIAGPPAVIIDSDQKESRNKGTTTISPTFTNIINSNLSTRPLTFATLYTQQSTQQSVSLHDKTTPRIDKSLTSTAPKITTFLLNISTKSSLVNDNAKEEKKELKRPKAKNWGVNHHKSQQLLTVPTVSSSSTIRHRIRTTLVSHTIYAVRPTTPMGEHITDTVKAPATPTDFPRTALISIASLSVIIIIAIVVFCVFRCRQSGPSTDQYPMVCSGKQSGYAPIPAELSPPLMRESSRQNAGPFFHNRVNQLDGYQPIKGAVIPNGNNLMTSNIKGNCASAINGRKKEFKEWYV
ncbi:hypothetical protein LOAG_11390 [Loa loa]|uniref:Protein kinase domain-containing protein n=1 Tax=Loa loa TaxID=7209 RepID=A0A1I7W4S5_LOALO|nr:hypothetical protein LOAG_11390 [Loa loa]EFO17111.1 hypothetical protein LOAG_11390 [Loa loa]